jgi:hypothetical protein
MSTTATEKALLRRTSAAKFSLLFPGQVLLLGLLAFASALGGLVTLGLSLADLAESKGQPREYGLLIGLGVIGLIWAVVLPDRNIEREWTKPTLQW